MKTLRELREKAVSQQQQKLMGLALAYKRGEVSDDEVSDQVRKMADSMSMKDLEDFAKTKHKGLPKKVDEYGGPPISRKDYLKQKPMDEAVSRRNFGKLQGVWKDSVSKNIIEFDENGMGFIVEDKRGGLHTFEYKNMNVLKENVEDEMPASPDEKRMAMKQAEFIQYVGREIGEHLVANKEFPEWMQNKLSALHQKAKDMHATLGAHGGDEMDESVELDEEMSDKDWVHIKRAGSFFNPKKDTIIGYSKSPKDPNRAPKVKSGANVALRIGDAKKKGYVIKESVELDEEQKLFMFKTKDEAQKKAKEIRGKVLELGPKNFAVVGKELTVVRESKKIPAAQLARLRKAYGEIDQMNVTGPAYKKLQKFLDGLDQEELKAFADADIKWLSRMAKRRIKEGINEEVELHENFIRNLRQVAQRLGLNGIAWKLLDMEKDKAAEKITQSDIDGFVKDAEEAYPMIKTTYQRYYKSLINKLKKAKGREALDMMQEIARYISKIQSNAKMRSEEVELTDVKEGRSFWDLRERMKDPADDDIVATDDDRKAADKNIVVQLRRVSDLPKGGEIEFKDGKKAKVSQQDAKKMLRGFDSLQKGQDKERFQNMAGKDLASMKRVLGMIKR